MKKLLTLLFVGLSLLGYAQKLQLINSEGVPYTDGQTITATITENNLNPATDAYHIDIVVKNITADKLKISTLCTTMELVDGMTVEVCFGGECHGGETIPISSEILGGEKETYQFHLKPNGNFGLSKFKFEFATDGETITLYAIIDMCKVGVKEQNATASLSAYPNPAPANSKINVAYTLADKNDNRLVIRNILGAMVTSLPLNPSENSISIDASDLKSGVYFYAIENKNQISVVKKLIIK